jgi:hypothetical protein
MVRYSQVLKVVEELERLGERPLVIMQRKYVSSTFRLANGAVQQLAPEALKVITRYSNQPGAACMQKRRGLVSN